MNSSMVLRNPEDDRYHTELCHSNLREMYGEDEVQYVEHIDELTSQSALPSKMRILQESKDGSSKRKKHPYRYQHKHKKSQRIRRRKLEEGLVTNDGYEKWYHYPQLTKYQNK